MLQLLLMTAKKVAVLLFLLCTLITIKFIYILIILRFQNTDLLKKKKLKWFVDLQNVSEKENPQAVHYFTNITIITSGSYRGGRRHYVSSLFSETGLSPFWRHSRMPLSTSSTLRSMATRWGSHRIGAMGSLAMLWRMASLSFVGPLWYLERPIDL